MKRKIKMVVLLSVIMILLTGCSIEYNLEIDNNNNFKENFVIDANVNAMNTMDDLYNSYLEEYPIYSDDYQKFMYSDPYSKNDDYTYYDKSYQRQENGYKFMYKANFTFKDINQARTFKTIFNTGGVGYLEDENYYYISLSNPTLVVSDSDIELNVNITFNGVEVISNNADRVRGNTYTWKIDSNTSINVKYKLKKSSSIVEPNVPDNDDKKNNNEDKQEDNLLDYILVGTVLLLFIIAILGVIKYKSINKSE